MTWFLTHSRLFIAAVKLTTNSYEVWRNFVQTFYSHCDLDLWPRTMKLEFVQDFLTLNHSMKLHFSHLLLSRTNNNKLRNDLLSDRSSGTAHIYRLNSSDPDTTYWNIHGTYTQHLTLSNIQTLSDTSPQTTFENFVAKEAI